MEQLWNNYRAIMEQLWSTNGTEMKWSPSGSLGGPIVPTVVVKVCNPPQQLEKLAVEKIL